MSDQINSGGSSRKAADGVKSGTSDKSSAAARDGQPQASGGGGSSSAPPTIEPVSRRKPVVGQQQHTTTGGSGPRSSPLPMQMLSQPAAAPEEAGQHGLGADKVPAAAPIGKQAAATVTDGASSGTNPKRALPRPSSDRARDARHARLQPASKEPARRTMTSVNLSKAPAPPHSGQQRGPAQGGPRLGHELRSSPSFSAVARDGKGGASGSGSSSSSSGGGGHVARSQQSKREPERHREQPSSKKLQRAQTQRNSISASKSDSANVKSKNDVAAASKAFKSSKTTQNIINKSTMVDQAVIDKLEAGFAKLQASTPEQCHSLLKKYLTREVLDNNKTKKTAMGATLLDVAQSGFENLDSGVGIYAPDAESYTLFADLFNPIIEDYHGGFKATDKHPQSDFGDINTLVNVDPTNEYVISTRVRCGRSLQGYPFNPCLTEAQYKEMESKVSSTLKEVAGDLAGTYYPLTGMTKETQQQLIDDHFLFKEGDRFLQAANACRYWPTGRGIYHNTEKTFLVWVNEEDHLRIISMQKGGDLKTIYDRLVRGAKAIEAKVPFSRDDRLGFLTFCPTNLGTTIRASVHIKLPKLAADRKKLEEVAGRYNLQVRGTSGEHTESIGGVYDISNKRRLGLTEYQAVREMQDGILELIKIEKSL